MSDLRELAKRQLWITETMANLNAQLAFNPKQVTLLANDDNRPLSILTVPFDPVTGNIGSGFVGSATSLAQGQGGVTGVTLPSKGTAGLDAIVYWNAANGSFDYAEEATSTATAYATNTTTNILASGGASKKYRIFSLTLTLETGAAADAVSAGDNAGVNNLFSFTAIGAAVAKQSLIINYGPNGILQPNAASAISVKASTATAGITGVLTYGVAR